MKNFRKIILTGALTLATVFTIQTLSNAATVKVTGEVVNIRKEASTDSKVVAQLSENVECEYLGEEGDWYKVKFQKYTGYVSKEYTKLIGEANNTTSNTNKNQTNENQENSEGNNSNNNQNNTSTNNTQTTNNENNNVVNNQSISNSEQTNNTQSNNNQEEEPKLIYKKFNQKATIKILPLIHSNNIGEAKKDDEIIVLAETSGWSYIQTNEINGWVRTDTLGQATTANSSASSNQGNTTKPAEKIGYISEEEVNMRKGAGTNYSIVKVLTLNTQVTILKEKGKWYQIKAGESTGYVSKDYVSDSKTVTNRSLTEPRTTDEDSNDNEKNSTTNKTIKNVTANTNKADNANTTNNITSTANKGTNTGATSTSNNKNNSSTNKNTSTDTTKGTDIIAYAKSFMGVPYVWGGASKSRI